MQSSNDSQRPVARAKLKRSGGPGGIRTPNQGIMRPALKAQIIENETKLGKINRTYIRLIQHGLAQFVEAGRS